MALEGVAAVELEPELAVGAVDHARRPVRLQIERIVVAFLPDETLDDGDDSADYRAQAIAAGFRHGSSKLECGFIILVGELQDALLHGFGHEVFFAAAPYATGVVPPHLGEEQQVGAVAEAHLEHLVGDNFLETKAQAHVLRVRLRNPLHFALQRVDADGAGFQLLQARIDGFQGDFEAHRIEIRRSDLGKHITDKKVWIFA